MRTRFITIACLVIVSTSHAISSDFTVITEKHLVVARAKLSPNGKMVAHVSKKGQDAKELDLYVTNLETSQTKCLTCDRVELNEYLSGWNRADFDRMQGTSGFNGGILWSPDSKHIISTARMYGREIDFDIEVSSSKGEVVSERTKKATEKKIYSQWRKSSGHEAVGVSLAEFIDGNKAIPVLGESKATFELTWKHETLKADNGQEIRRAIVTLRDRNTKKTNKVLSENGFEVRISLKGEKAYFKNYEQSGNGWRVVNLINGKTIDFPRKGLDFVGWHGEDILVIRDGQLALLGEMAN